MEFADLALAKFLQTAPELGPYIINFSDITTEMPGSGPSSNNIGLFILKAGGGIVTVPVVAKADTLYPIDSVFIEAERQFRPLSPATISYIVDMASSSPGKLTKIPDTVDKNPNLQNLINPPRTGKFNYASASRLVEFLAMAPDNVKRFTFEKLASEQSLYNTLDKMFGLKAIFSALNGSSGGTGAVNSVASGPTGVREIGFSVITTPREIGDLMDDSLAKTFIDQGYVVTGGSDSLRTAMAYEPYNYVGTFNAINPNTDGNKEFNVVMINGTSKRAYVPKYHLLNPYHISDMEDNGSFRELVSVFEDGTYARGSLITNGDPLPDLEVLKNVFNLTPPKLLRDLEMSDTFLVFTHSGEALGPFTANGVMRTANGTEIKVYNGDVKRICGYQNFTKDAEVIGDTLFLPNNVIVLTLGSDITNDVEVNINKAACKKELIISQYLGAEMDLRHDGMEFSIGGTPVGGYPSAMKILVEDEYIDPDMAQNFLKQAEVTKFVKIFLSKKASSTDFNPTDVPQYGAVAPRIDDPNINGSFTPAVQSAASLDDSQVLESTIIAQLLQVPDLFEFIQEYLPDINDTVDKLGRILFLSRVKIDDMSQSLDPDSIFAMIAQIKNVYRQLGDTSLKLQGIAGASVGFTGDKKVGKTRDS